MTQTAVDLAVCWVFHNKDRSPSFFWASAREYRDSLLTGRLLSKHSREKIIIISKKKVDFKACRLPDFFFKWTEEIKAHGCPDKHNTSQHSTEPKKNLCINILSNIMEAAASPSWKQESPFRWCSYSRVNYNYGRFNLAVNRKQVFGLRYVNAMSRSIETAEGTNLFSHTQTNFPLIRTTHWAQFLYPLSTDEQALHSTQRLWDM